MFDGLEICKHGQKYLRSDEVVAFFTARRYDQAIAALRTIEDPINEVRGWLTASYADAGRLDEARAMLEEFLRVAKDDMAMFPGRKLAASEPSGTAPSSIRTKPTSSTCTTPCARQDWKIRRPARDLLLRVVRQDYRISDDRSESNPSV